MYQHRHTQRSVGTKAGPPVSKVSKACREEVPPIPKGPLFPKIAKMHNVCQLLRQAITQHQHSYDMTKAIQATRDQAGSIDYELPLALQDCEEAYKQKRKELSKAEKEEIKDGKLPKELQEELMYVCMYVNCPPASNNGTSNQYSCSTERPSIRGYITAMAMMQDLAACPSGKLGSTSSPAAPRVPPGFAP